MVSEVDPTRETPARKIARESLALRAEQDGAHHTAECWRSGKWDENGELEAHTNTAALAMAGFRDPFFIVLKVWGNHTLTANQTIAYTSFVQDDAERKAKRLQTRNGFRYIVVPVFGDMRSAIEKVRQEYLAKGFEDA